MIMLRFSGFHSIVKPSFEATGGEGNLKELGFGGRRAQGGV